MAKQKLTGSQIGDDDCWRTSNDTWIYGAANQFIIIGSDQTLKYTKGTRIKWTQTTVKYGVIVQVNYSAGNTYVAIGINTDYAFTNSAITNNFYSYAANPQGYPSFFNFSIALSAAGGTSPTYTSKSARYSINGGSISVIATLNNTSGGTAGAGGVLLQGYTPISGSLSGTIGIVRVYNGGTAIAGKIILHCHAIDNADGTFYMTSDGYNILASDQNNVNRYMQIDLNYIF